MEVLPGNLVAVSWELNNNIQKCPAYHFELDCTPIPSSLRDHRTPVSPDVGAHVFSECTIVDGSPFSMSLEPKFDDDEVNKEIEKITCSYTGKRMFRLG